MLICLIHTETFTQSLSHISFFILYLHTNWDHKRIPDPLEPPLNGLNVNSNLIFRTIWCFKCLVVNSVVRLSPIKMWQHLHQQQHKRSWSSVQFLCKNDIYYEWQNDVLANCFPMRNQAELGSIMSGFSHRTNRILYLDCLVSQLGDAQKHMVTTLESRTSS